MATNLALDDRLIEEARRVGRHPTKREAVTAALREYVQRRKQLGILELVGKVEYWDDHDPRALRRRRRS
jgi:Arc/MetJ family transcription regulator